MPGATCDVVNVGSVIFVAVGVNLIVLAEERSLIECVLVRQAARLLDVVLLRVEYVRRARRVAILLAAEDQNLVLRDSAGSEPVLDVGLKRGRPDLDQLPVGRLLSRGRVKALDVGDGWLVATEDVDVALLNGHGGRQVAVPVQLWLLAPAVVLDRVDLASLRGVVQSRAYGVDQLVADGSKAMALTRVDHVRQLDERAVPELVGMITRL